MNTVVLRRRLIYICAMVALIIPIRLLGEPSIHQEDGSLLEENSGGALARIRAKYDLGQGDLGQIDPASESMRLATLGLRGVACTILWMKAEEYKKEKYWDRLSATLNQIAVLQPHFIKVWEFQSHNMSYNVSTEFDNYKHRYDWVKKGIDYLITGSRYNKHRTEMPYELGWFFGNKMGVADEKEQYRDLYRNDEEFHEEIERRSGVDMRAAEGQGADGKPDNWKSGRLWYQKAYAMVDRGDRPARSAMMFYRMGPQWLMKHAEAIQKEGILDDYSRQAWKNAGRGWLEFGNRSIETTFGDTIRLADLKQANAEYEVMKEDFIEYCGETYAKLRAQRETTLTDFQREALALDYAERNFEQVVEAEKAQSALKLNPEAVAKQLPSEKRIVGLEKAKNLVGALNRIKHIEIYQNQINYLYWEQRCVAEQEQEALDARKAMFEAEELLELGELDGAIKQYEVAFENWSQLFNMHPSLMIDEAGDSVLDSVDRYLRLLDEPLLPEDFALGKFMQFRQRNEENLNDPALMTIMSTWNELYPDRNFLDEMAKKSKQMSSLLGNNPDLPTIQVNKPLNGEPPVPFLDPAVQEKKSDEPTTEPESKSDDTTDSDQPTTVDVNKPLEGDPPLPSEKTTSEETPESSEESQSPTAEEDAAEKDPDAPQSRLKVNPPLEGSAPVPK